MANNKAETLTASTTSALDQEIDRMQPADGVALIKDWLTTLKGNAATSGIAGDLKTLHDELQSEDPDGLKISEIMKNLSQATEAALGAADDNIQDELQDLADALSRTAQSLQ